MHRRIFLVPVLLLGFVVLSGCDGLIGWGELGEEQAVGPYKCRIPKGFKRVKSGMGAPGETQVVYERPSRFGPGPGFSFTYSSHHGRLSAGNWNEVVSTVVGELRRKCGNFSHEQGSPTTLNGLPAVRLTFRGDVKPKSKKYRMEAVGYLVMDGSHLMLAVGMAAGSGAKGSLPKLENALKTLTRPGHAPMAGGSGSGGSLASAGMGARSGNSGSGSGPGSGSNDDDYSDYPGGSGSDEYPGIGSGMSGPTGSSGSRSSSRPGSSPYGSGSGYPGSGSGYPGSGSGISGSGSGYPGSGMGSGMSGPTGSTGLGSSPYGGGAGRRPGMSGGPGMSGPGRSPFGSGFPGIGPRGSSGPGSSPYGSGMRSGMSGPTGSTGGPSRTPYGGRSGYGMSGPTGSTGRSGNPYGSGYPGSDDYDGEDGDYDGEDGDGSYDGYSGGAYGSGSGGSGSGGGEEMARRADATWRASQLMEAAENSKDPEYISANLEIVEIGNTLQKKGALGRLAKISSSDIEESTERAKFGETFAKVVKDPMTDVGVRRNVIPLMVKWDADESVPVLIELLGANHTFLQMDALEQLTALKDERCIEAVTKLFVGNVQLREEAGECLREFGSAAEDKVLEYAAPRDVHVTKAAVRLLGDIGTRKSIGPLNLLRSLPFYGLVKSDVSRATSRIRRREEAAESGGK